MEGEVKGKTFKMKGHTLPGINQRSDAKATNVAEQGLAGSSVFQQGIRKDPMMQGAEQGAGMPGVNPTVGMVPNIGGGVGVFPHKPSVAKIYNKSELTEEVL